MKLTKEKLKQIIKEELEDMQEQASDNSRDVKMLLDLIHQRTDSKGSLLGRTFKTVDDLNFDYFVGLSGLKQSFDSKKERLDPPQEMERFTKVLNQAVKIVTDQGQIAKIDGQIGNPPFKPSIAATSFTVQAKS